MGLYIYDIVPDEEVEKHKVLSKDEAKGASKAKVTWSWEDINELKPNWSKEECKNFLQEHENGIQEAMLEAGWFAIKLAIGEY